MDILAPDIQVIDGIHYRILAGHFESNYSKKTQEYFENEDEETGIISPDEETEDDFEIEVDRGGRFRSIFQVPKVYIPYLIGAKGASKKRIESETKTRITMPRIGQDGDVLITGSGRRDVVAAIRRMTNLARSARKKQPFTHFISFPLTSSSFKNGFLKFKNDVLQNCQDRGIEESIFQSVDKLHLTVCTLVLCDDRERKQASSVLENCKADVIRPLLSNQNLRISLCGIEYMNDDPSEVDVLYGKVCCKDNPELLQKLADDIVSYFVKKDLVNQEYDRVKLHVTLMNTIFRKSSTTEEDGKGKRETFDAKSVLRDFEDFYFGEGEMSEVHLSLRYSTADTGYYIATASLQIP